MLKALATGLFGRVLGYAALALGFWLLYKGVSGPNVPWAILGGAAILGAMYLMVVSRRSFSVPEAAEATELKEEVHGDPCDRSE